MESEARPIDGDSHLHEPPAMWRDYIDPAMRDSAIAIEDDELGYPWLTWRGRRLYLAEVQFPRRAGEIGDMRLRLERGERAEARYQELLPPAYTEPRARLARLDEWGLAGTVLFPNFGLLWEDMLSVDPVAQRANMRAFNRWMGEVVQSGQGRLFPVAHLALDDQAWVEEELSRLSKDGIKLAMIAPAPVLGKALSHPDLDPIWAAFCSHDVAPVFHVGDFTPPLHPAWYEADPEPVDKLMSSIFLWVAPAAAIASMIIQGTLERFPGLRIGVVELTAEWVPHFLLTLDGASAFYRLRHGRPLRQLSLKPSEYFLRQVRVGALAYEQPARLIGLVGQDTYMYGSDWPHAEGLAEPLSDYEDLLTDLPDIARRKLFRDNVRWLLNA